MQGSYAQQQDAAGFSQAGLDQLLAPIALYPDPLLSQILMAATYPLEVVQAERFVQQNPGLSGDALAQAVQGLPWDPSIQSLVQFPSVLGMMDNQLSWTQRLGDAFLAQQGAVMDTVQALRAAAQAAGTLANTPQQAVQMQDGAIDIEPYAPDVVYVPYYDPTLVYGAWWWPNNRPFVWIPQPYYQAPYYNTVQTGGIAFGVGIGVVNPLFIYCRPNWAGHNFIYYPNRPRNRPDHNRTGWQWPQAIGAVWTPNPTHRLATAYRNTATRDRLQLQQSNDSGNLDAYRGRIVRAIPPSAPTIAPRVEPAPQPVFNAPRSEQTMISPPVQVQPAAMRQPVEPIRPFMPAAPAKEAPPHADRGKESREAPNSAPHPAEPFEHR